MKTICSSDTSLLLHLPTAKSPHTEKIRPSNASEDGAVQMSPANAEICEPVDDYYNRHQIVQNSVFVSCFSYY